MSRVVAIANQKGGVGKTTTAVNLGASLAVAEQRVLLVDLDPQGNASTGVGMSPNDEDLEGSYEVLLGDVDAADVIYETEMPYMHVIAATQDLVGAERDLLQADDSASRLRDALQAVRDDYDFIVVDCPPSLGMLTINALTAADMVIVPLQCEYYALEGLSQLVGTIERVRASVNEQLQIHGVLLTMFDAQQSGQRSGGRGSAALSRVRDDHSAKRPVSRGAFARKAGDSLRCVVARLVHVSQPRARATR